MILKIFYNSKYFLKNLEKEDKKTEYMIYDINF